MIKKILLGLGIIFLSFIGFSSAIDLSKSYKNGNYVEFLDDFEVAVYNRGTLASQKLGNTKRMIAFKSNSNLIGSTLFYERKYFWWNNGIPYFYFSNKGQSVNTTTAGSFDYYYLCDAITGENNDTFSVINCFGDTYDSNFLGQFFNSITANDYRGYYSQNGNLLLRICFSSQSFGKSVCFQNNGNSYTTVNMDSNIDFGSFPSSLLGDPPGRFTSGGGDNGGGSSSVTVGITPGSIESALNYYENVYGWDSSICYAGVDSLSYLYGQNGVSYQKGNGLSIFDIYYQLFGTGYTKEDMLLYSSRWLNSWLINYHERFDTGGDPSWLAYYNSGTHLVDYQFDNLVFPFSNQPVAFYFLTDNIQSQTEQLTQGEEVVSYCNIKINSGTFDEIIGDGNKNNIINNTEQRNTNVGLNPDGSKHEYTGAFLGSGVNLAFSGNVSIKNTLKNFFDKLNDSISINSVPGVVSILPDWLVVAFLTIMLFKFFRKKS